MSEDKLREEILSLKAEIKRLRKSLMELTPPLPTLLRRRGFRIFKKEPPDDLFIPARRYIDDFYHFMNKYSFRLFLRDVIKRQKEFRIEDVTRYSTREVTEDYTRFLLSMRLVEKAGRGDVYHVKGGPIRSFGPTLEWFLSEVFKREFEAETIWGIKFKRTAVGGDYDLLAKIDSSLLYMEVKSSPPKQIYANEISAYFDRVIDLRPEIAVFLMDTELRMKDKIVPMFEAELARRHSSPPEVTRMERELFQIQNRVFIINSKEDIVRNLEKVLYQYYKTREPEFSTRQ